jgi:hypothetical protein
MADREAEPQQVEPRHDGSAVNPSQHGIEGMLHPRPEVQDEASEKPEDGDAVPAVADRSGQTRAESPEDAN